MGVTPTALRLLAREIRRHAVKGAVLTLGNQDVWATEEDARSILRSEGLDPVACELRLNTSALFADLARHDAKFGRYIHATSLFQMLGFTSYADLDKYAQDAAMLRVDLNEPLPAPLRSSFDLIVDFGTTEHVFSVPTALSSIAGALKTGGVAVHALPLPSLYWAQHGYYCFSPDLFLDFYEANGFKAECTITYYKKPFLRPIDQSIYFTRAYAFPYRRGVNLNYLVPADSAPTFWLSARKDREVEKIVAPNQEENHIATSAGSRPGWVRAAAKTAFFALQPFLGGLARRSYMSSVGLAPSRV